ncbi:unnamed protein product [Cuscuta campestris]|uniref:Uncharacterized protein n=1 Tax=Cuscuta campestris TaxID=132261 RepID=A0A484L352_9ASTE|nr:unnamed protein product [Cuscuta campestris]
MLRKKKKEQENQSSVQNPEHKTISPLEHPEGIAKKVWRWNVENSELIVGIMFIDIPEILDSNFLLTSESNGLQFREETMEICPNYHRLSNCGGNDKVGKFRCCFHSRSSVRFQMMISRCHVIIIKNNYIDYIGVM